MINTEERSLRINQSRFINSASQLERRERVRVAIGNRDSLSYLFNIFSISFTLPSIKTDDFKLTTNKFPENPYISYYLFMYLNRK